MLELKTSYHSDILNVELYGALDSLTAPDFRFWLIEKSQTGYHYFSLNCVGLEYISSRGIGVLTELNNVLNEGRCRLVLYNVSNEVLNLLEFLKLADTIPIVNSFSQVKDKFEHKQEEAVRAPNPVTASSFSFSGFSPAEEPENGRALEDDPDETGNGLGNVRGEAEFAKTQDEVDEEYILLNQGSKQKENYDVSKMSIVFCPNCGENLRVSQKGLYLCPECRTKFNYPFR